MLVSSLSLEEVIGKNKLDFFRKSVHILVFSVSRILKISFSKRSKNQLSILKIVLFAMNMDFQIINNRRMSGFQNMWIDL